MHTNSPLLGHGPQSYLDTLWNTCKGDVFLDFLLCFFPNIIVQAVSKGQAVHLLLGPEECSP